MELRDILEKVDLLKGQLDELRPIAPDRMNRIMQKLRLDWNYHSNSIEGNTLTLTETRALIRFGLTAKGKPIRDHIEMRGHNTALKKLESIVSRDLNITESLIKDFHRLILVEPYEGDSEINPGEYKKKPNYLYSPEGERIDFEPPEVVPVMMNELINWLNNHLEPPKRKKQKYDLHPLLVACIFHLRFIRIHPFGDGNGRMARILMNLILMRQGYMPSIVRLEKKLDYYSALNQSSEEDIEPLATFIGEELVHSMEIAIKGAKGESIESDDLGKRVEKLAKSLSGTPKIITKSQQIISKVIQDVYIPFIYNLDMELEIIDELFENSTWQLLHDIEITSNASVFALFAQPSYDLDFAQAIDKMTQKGQKGEDDEYAIIKHWERFNREDDTFNLDIWLGVMFSERTFTITVVVGEPNHCRDLFRGLDDLRQVMSDGKAQKKTKELAFEKINYNSLPDHSAIGQYSKDVAHLALELIEEKNQKINR